MVLTWPSKICPDSRKYQPACVYQAGQTEPHRWEERESTLLGRVAGPTDAARRARPGWLPGRQVPDPLAAPGRQVPDPLAFIEGHPDAHHRTDRVVGNPAAAPPSRPAGHAFWSRLGDRGGPTPVPAGREGGERGPLVATARRGSKSLSVWTPGGVRGPIFNGVALIPPLYRISRGFSSSEPQAATNHHSRGPRKHPRPIVASAPPFEGSRPASSSSSSWNLGGTLGGREERRGASRGLPETAPGPAETSESDPRPPKACPRAVPPPLFRVGYSQNL